MNTYAIKGSGKWCLGSKRLFLLLLGCWLPMLLSAQRNAYWHFGDSVVLNWDTSDPIVMPPSAMVAHEPSSSMSDTAGNLLFYTNGNRIWNRNGTPMSNGDSVINVSSYDPFFSITQGTLVLPYPDNPSKYVMVYNGILNADPISGYSVIDMQLDGGLGDVIPGLKGVILDSLDTSEKCTAVKHANGRDWWVVQYEFYKEDLGVSDNTFHFYLLTPSGIEYNHAQTIGLPGTSFLSGEMIFSEDGSMLGMAGFGGVQVYGFDRCTGLLTEPKVQLEGQFSYGAAFSPNGRFFYFTTSIDRELFQYDLLPDGNADTITLLASGSGPIEFGQLELGVDGKIYMVVWRGLSSTPIDEYLHVLNSPDLFGIASDFELFGFYLGGFQASVGLPNMVNYELGRLEGSPCDTVYAVDTTTAISTPPLDLDFTVSPTVSHGLCWLKGPSAEGQTVMVDVVDVNGRLVWQAEGILPMTIDLTGQAAGMYVLRVEQGVYEQTFKLVRR